MGSVLDKQGSSWSEKAEKVVGGLGSFIKELVTDPTTYIPIGGGPLGKLGAVLAGSSHSPEAEAVFINTNHIDKAYESLLKHLKKGTPEQELWRTVGKETGYPSSILPWKMAGYIYCYTYNSCIANCGLHLSFPVGCIHKYYLSCVAIHRHRDGC